MAHRTRPAKLRHGRFWTDPATQQELFYTKSFPRIVVFNDVERRASRQLPREFVTADECNEFNADTRAYNAWRKSTSA